MTEQTDFLTRISDALAARAQSARSSVVAIQVAEERHISGTLWRPDAVVTSEQALPRREEFQAVLPGGVQAVARVAGRDAGTNVALLHIPEQASFVPLSVAQAETGALALAYGAHGSGEVTARMGIVNLAGPEWHSSAGGRIDRRIVLDIRIGRMEEGGPVFDREGACLGMSTFGPRGQVLVIPAQTIDRTVPALLKDGRVVRGWLGVALQPVAVPEPLQGQAGQSSGLMVMSIAEGGPAARAGIVAGDIVLTLNGTPARKLRRAASHLGSDSIGQSAELQLIRAGGVLSLQVTIEARPAE